VQKRLSWPGVEDRLESQERAGWDTSGGLTSVPEGLGYFCRPCARVLSVAGFFALIAPFPPGEWFIPEVRKSCFLGEEALLFDVTNRTVIHPANTTRMPVSRLARRRMYRRVHTYGAWWEGIY